MQVEGSKHNDPSLTANRDTGVNLLDFFDAYLQSICNLSIALTGLVLYNCPGERRSFRHYPFL